MKPEMRLNEPPETYHATRAISKSGMDKLRQAPAKFKAWMDGVAEEETEALLFGSVFHCLALEPGEFGKRYAVKQFNGSTKAGKEEATTAKAAGLELVPTKIHNAASAMAESVLIHPLIGKLMTAKDKRTEVSIYWSETVDGLEIPCKARLDMLATVPGFGLVAVDLKSTDDASPEGLASSVLKWGYHRQAVWYRRALRAVGMDSSVFVLVAVEKTAPHLVTAANVSEAAQQVGLEEIKDTLSTYASCTKSGLWPGYVSEIIDLDLPEWAYKRRFAA